jgi:hypothetical protein
MEDHINKSKILNKIIFHKLKIQVKLEKLLEEILHIQENKKSNHKVFQLEIFILERKKYKCFQFL